MDSNSFHRSRGVLQWYVDEPAAKIVKYIFKLFLDGLLYLYEKNHRLSVAKEMRDTKLRVEQAKKRIKELTNFVSETEAEIQAAKQDAVDLKAFLENIRECTDIQKLTPTLVNTLIKKIEIFNSDIVTVPDEEEIIAAMEEIRNNPTKVA